MTSSSLPTHSRAAFLSLPKPILTSWILGATILDLSPSCHHSLRPPQEPGYTQYHCIYLECFETLSQVIGFQSPLAALCDLRYNILNWAIRASHLGPPRCHFSFQLSWSGHMLSGPSSSRKGDFCILMLTSTWEFHLHFLSCQCPGCGPQFCSLLGIFSALSEARACPSLCDFPADWQLADCPPRTRPHTGSPASLVSYLDTSP